MNIKKQNTLIEISESGLKLEIKADLLLNSVISETTTEVLSELIKHKLSLLKFRFIEIHNIVELERKINKSTFFDSLKEIRDNYVYEYACLTRDLYSLLPDTFDDFCDENKDIMDTIASIYRYSHVYGFTPTNDINI